MRRVSPLALRALRRLACAVAVAGAGAPACGDGPAAPPPRVPTIVTPQAERPDAPPPPRADGRLPDAVRPTHYDVALEIDPRRERFRGAVSIMLDVRARTFHVVLHGRDLAVARASAKVGDAILPATVTPRLASGGQTAEELVVSFPRALEAGATATLTIEYDAPFGADLTGLYRARDGGAGAWYAFTDFEPTDARKMLPCFDEPSFKAPFDVKLTVPRGMLAIANWPEASRREDDGQTTTFRFATTKPLPTYLVALAVGDFDVREGGKSPAPLRVITPKGKGDLAELALEAAAGVGQALETYLKVPFPFPKLDLVAVPEFATGAMENAGMITFRQETLLVDPRAASARTRRGLATIMAHEVAHQWFGDLVTAEWWNDLWLNEAMATWLQARAVAAWQPQLGTRYDVTAGALGVMDQDGLAAARAVRQPVRTVAEAREAFDGITYAKGAAVLGMLEAWVGEQPFQSALHAYLDGNAFGNATADTLLALVERAAHKDVREVAGTFLDRPGVPLVTAHLECEHGRWGATLQQEAWRPLGGAAPDTQQTWTHPICVRVEGRSAPVCTVLAGGAPSLVAGTGRCPAWVLPNDGAAGYFRVAQPGPELAALGRVMPGQDPIDRLAFVSNAWAAVRAGAMGPEPLLRVLPAFDKDEERVVVEAVTSTLAGLDGTVVEDGARALFQKYVAARLGKHKERLGWTRAAKDEDARALLRRTVLVAMADLAGDAATLREAEVLARAWLKEPASVDADAAPIALELASRAAGEERLAALLMAAKRARAPAERVMALRAMAGFDAPSVLEKALDLTLTADVRPAEVFYVLGGAAGRRASRPVLARWAEAHWDALRAKLPGDLARGVGMLGGLSCTKEGHAAAAAFYGPRVHPIEGAARGLDVALESAAACAELRARAGDATTKALKGKLSAL